MKALSYYYLGVFSFFGLFALLMFWHTLWYPSLRFPKPLVLILVIGPLLLPFRGLLKADPRSTAWMAYLSIAYLMHGCVEAYVNPLERLPALLEVGFSSLLFIGTTFYIRFRDR